MYFQAQPSTSFFANLTFPMPLIDTAVNLNFQQPPFYSIAFICTNNVGTIHQFAGLQQIILPNSISQGHYMSNFVPLLSEEIKETKNIFSKIDLLENKTIQKQSQSEYRQPESKQEHLSTKNDHKIRKKYKQNIQRNVITNIGNQLLSFIGNRKKSQEIYFKINKQASEKQIGQFYAFINKLRKRKKSPIYFNEDKLLQIWYPQNTNSANHKNLKIVRQMSLIFIQQFLPLFMLNSVRIKKQTKLFHISAVRKLLKLLRYRKSI